MTDSKKTPRRCPWSLGVSDDYLRYHDEEWGVPVRDDQRQFEFLVLESAQAGLSWSTILHKRAGYRRAFVTSTALAADGAVHAQRRRETGARLV